MNIFVAGASGAIGRPLVKLLSRQGHRVIGMARTKRGADLVRRLGGESVQVDAFDGNAVMAALKQAEPQVVIDEITSLPQNLA